MKVAIKTDLIIFWLLMIFAIGFNLIQLITGTLNIIATIITVLSVMAVIASRRALNQVQKELDERQMIINKSNLDGLTGLLNRRAAQENILNILESEAHPVAMYMIDLDYFKYVNDKYGHLAGDEVLKAVADALVKVFENEYIVSRWGGDEFVVFLQNIPKEDFVERKAQEICKSVNSLRCTEKNIHISVSIGIQLVESPARFDILYNGADEALYRTKQNGRNGYTINKKRIVLEGK
ncbi:MAG: GGDEF domain-containing protein [Aminipila sp.]